MKSVVIISSIIVMCSLEPKKVYVKTEGGQTSIEYSSKDKVVNLFIDRTLVSDKVLQNAIKMYIASFFVKNKEVLKRDFQDLYKYKLPVFAQQYQKELSNVIYYLEHADHGNLPFIYGREAYRLLEIKELQPAIRVFKERLYQHDMYIIDIDAREEPTLIDIDSLKK